MEKISSLLISLLSSTKLPEDKILATSSALEVLTFFFILASASNLPETICNTIVTLACITGVVAQDFYKNHAMVFLACLNIAIATYYFASANPAMGLFFLFDATSCLITKYFPKDGYKWSSLLDLASSTSLGASNPIAGIISLMADLVSITSLPQFKKAVANLFLAAQIYLKRPNEIINNIGHNEEIVMVNHKQNKSR
jgi:hypothetical protein